MNIECLMRNLTKYNCSYWDSLTVKLLIELTCSYLNWFDETTMKWFDKRFNKLYNKLCKTIISFDPLILALNVLCYGECGDVVLTVSWAQIEIRAIHIQQQIQHLNECSMFNVGTGNGEMLLGQKRVLMPGAMDYVHEKNVTIMSNLKYWYLIIIHWNPINFNWLVNKNNCHYIFL